MPRQGLSVMREQTRKFIDENPTDVVLSRGGKEDDGAGGTRVVNPQPLAKQRMRVVPQSALGNTQRTFAGEVRRPDAALVAKYDADVAIGDLLAHNGTNYEVMWVLDHGYEKIVELAVR